MKSKSTTILLAVLAIGCLWAAARLHKPLLALRREHGMNAVEALENAPPLVVFTTVALGGFRGLIADALWIRATEMQDAGKYFETVQLTDWITKLEPDLADVWAFHAWNMAYNISILFPNPEDRWRWVRNGIRLLRDEGMRYNAGDPLIYRELALMYQQKVGGRWDDAGSYYRLKLAEEMAGVLGGGRPDYDGLFRAGSEAARELRERHNLSPETMREVDEKYGPLDWRLPETHAVYWAYRGLRVGKVRSLGCDRMVFQSMAALFRQGRMIVDAQGKRLILLPDTELVFRTIQAYEEAHQRHTVGAVGDAYANFMGEAVLTLSALQETQKAAEVYDLLKRKFPAAAGADLDGCVAREIDLRIGTMGESEAAGYIREMLAQADTWAKLCEVRRAEGMLKIARRMWERYAAGRGGKGAALPAFDEIARGVGDPDGRTGPSWRGAGNTAEEETR